MSTTESTITGPDPIELGGRPGHRYAVADPFPFTGVPAVDVRLSSYAVAVFRPEHRPARETPVVVALNGMAAPYHWLGFLGPTLLDMGIACVLFETPLAGDRSVVRAGKGDIVQELMGFVEHRVPISAALVVSLFHAVAKDYATVLRLVEDRYGLTDPRRALFGVSLGTLRSSFAFLRDGIGTRLLGTIGHADLPRFVRSYTPPSVQFLSAMPLGLLGRVAGARATAGLAFLRVLDELARGRGHAHTINPMGYADRIGEGRRVRLLVGERDPVVRRADAIACAGRFPDGECYVVPGLGHGDDGFQEHVRFFLGTQLGDWAGSG